MNHDEDTAVQPIGELEQGEGNQDVNSLSSWKTISLFEVQVSQRSKITAPVFANGNQQVPVEIVIQARDVNGVVINLSPYQLSRIKLIDYNNGTVIPDVTNSRDSRFIYHWEIVRDDAADLGGDVASPGETTDVAAGQTVFLYVRKNVISTTKVAAEIISPDGVAFRTNTPNPTPGKFDSWVNIQGREAPKYDHNDLIIERVDEITNVAWDVDLYYIRFSEKNLDIVGSVHMDAAADAPHLNKIHNGNQSRFHIAFAVGPKRTISYANSGGIAGTSFEVNKRPGEATAARCIVKNVSYYRERRTEACLWYFNQYGNVARCALGNSYTDDYNMLTLEAIWHG
jgi:hypothetical protein